MQHRGNHAGRAVGRRGDDTAARRVLLVDGHRIQVDPVEHRQRVAQRLFRALAQAGVQLGRAALHPHRAGQVALDLAAALDARGHRAPDREQPGAHFVGGTQRAFVAHHQLGDRQPVLAALAHQVVAGAERIRHLDGRTHAVHAIAVAVHDEAAADRVILFLDEQLAVLVEGLEAHPVRVHDARAAHQLAIEADVLLFLEADGLLAEQRQRFLRADRGEPWLDQVRIDRVGQVALETEQHGLVGAVALAGRAERAV